MNRDPEPQAAAGTREPLAADSPHPRPVHSDLDPAGPFRSSRRRLLGGAAGSLLLAGIAEKLARGETAVREDPGRPRSVILLWLEGGNSQLETFDPHPGTKIGGEVKGIATSVGGVEFSDTLPQAAEQLHRATLVRSMIGDEGDHERAVYQIKSGFRPAPALVHPSIGAVLCHADPEVSDLPRHISIVPGGHPARGGYLGQTFDAFKVGDPASPVPDVKSRVDDERYRRRVGDLLRVVEPGFARGRIADLERTRTLHATATKAAMRLMSSEQLAAFHVADEPRAEREAFGDTAFGRGCLAAARLVEAGVRCVEVTLGGWDSHVSNHSLQSAACEPLDPALASLLRRLADRDLLDTTLVVCGGEFGRTPRINVAEGRDHWPHGFSTLLAGGPFRRGHVHGATASEVVPGDDPSRGVSEPVTVADLHATILAGFGIDPSHEIETPIGRPMKRSEGNVIRSLLRT